jgi:hypothetical protein
MSGFHQTRMGERFYCKTMPELVEQLARLSRNLERLLDLAEKASPQEAPPTVPEEQER